MPLTVNEVDNQFAEIFGEPISTYTRAQAIEDGVLVDVSNLAKECGFKYPVALTSRVYGEVVVPPIEAQSFQDDIGRLWDILTILKMEVKRSKPGQSRIDFFILVQNKPEKLKRQYLKAICGPGDNAEPVITVMLPEED